MIEFISGLFLGIVLSWYVVIRISNSKSFRIIIPTYFIRSKLKKLNSMIDQSGISHISDAIDLYAYFAENSEKISDDIKHAIGTHTVNRWNYHKNKVQRESEYSKELHELKKKYEVQ